ncbi:MAG TPA: hypothetical protein VMS41_10920 [Gaiellaceae bacterium]|nr:hypothetical protein [Gaiellaceae bacterium]
MIKLIDVAVPPPTPDLLQQAHAESLIARRTWSNRAHGFNGVFTVEPV